jgi:5-methyltetrahydrofolate--homocysteine methyltransferase
LRESFIEATKKRVLLFDGAMGTEIQRLNPKTEDFPDGKDGFNDGLNLSRPEWIKQIHRTYLQAGADCIETNTFGSNKFKLAEYGYGDKTIEFNKKAAELAREVCNGFKDKQRYIIGSMGPSGYLPSSNDPALGETPLDEIQQAFMLEVKLTIEACHMAMEKVAKKVSIIANVTLDQYGKMLLGTTIQAAYTTVSNMNIDAFGLNCSTGPHEMTPNVRWLSEQDLPILVMPNAGMPQNEGGRAIYRMTPKEISQALEDFVNKYDHVRMIGGCCGTNPQHIAELRRVLDASDKKK